MTAWCCHHVTEHSDNEVEMDKRVKVFSENLLWLQGTNKEASLSY
jgi:hypothetical protein